MFTESVLTELSPAAAQLLRQIGARPDTYAVGRARWYATLPEPPEVAFTTALAPLLAHGWVEQIQVDAPAALTRRLPASVLTVTEAGLRECTRQGWAALTLAEALGARSVAEWWLLRAIPAMVGGPGGPTVFTLTGPDATHAAVSYGGVAPALSLVFPGPQRVAAHAVAEIWPPDMWQAAVTEWQAAYAADFVSLYVFTPDARLAEYLLKYLPQSPGRLPCAVLALTDWVEQTLPLL